MNNENVREVNKRLASFIFLLKVERKVVKKSMSNDIWRDYCWWLMNVAGIFDEQWYNLCSLLHSLSVGEPIIADDANRFDDGMAQRDYFVDKLPWDEQQFAEMELEKHPCSFFEMLVALAVRIDNEYLGDPKAPDPGKWLFKMLDNLDITKYARYNDIITSSQERIIIKRVEFMLDREYDDCGNINIFKLKRPISGFHCMSIWQQMQIWMSEYYNLGGN